MTTIVLVCASTGICVLCKPLVLMSRLVIVKMLIVTGKSKTKGSERLSNSLFNNVMHTHFSFLIFDTVNASYDHLFDYSTGDISQLIKRFLWLFGSISFVLSSEHRNALHAKGGC